MKFWQIAGAVIVMGLALMVIVPVVIRAVHALLIPGVIGVALYLIVRMVNAHLNR
jgi:hypothetical protein